MRVSRTKAAVALTAALALVLSGCGSSEEEAQAGGELRVNIGEPKHMLPTNAGESEGIYALSWLYTPLIGYDAKTKEPVKVIADKIESSDKKVWTITLKEGFTFHNGEPVNADSFIRAWNYAAYSPNAQGNSYFFDRIAGYEDLQSKDPDGEGPAPAPAPKADKLSGLEKVDDTTFKVTLNDPFTAFEMMLGYIGFAPLAEACLKDVKACEETPIGNGPFKVDGKWVHNQTIKAVKYDKYAGEKPKIDKLTFKIYDKVDTAYQDYVAGNVDLLRGVPPEKYTEAKGQYADKMIEEPSSSFAYIGIPLKLPAFQDKRVRQAFSMAIDRAAIIKAVFNDRFVPANSVVSPVVPGNREDACKYCKYDPEAAKKLLDEAGGFKGGKLQLWYNAGAGHEVWMQAVGDQLKKNLGIEYELKGNLQFAQYLEISDKKAFAGPFRLGWGKDYPSMENYLKPLYGTQGSSNATGYTNPEADALIAKGDQADSLDEGIKLYQQAEDLILEDLPVIPMWFGKTSILTADKVGNVEYNTVEEDVDLHKVTVK